MSRLELKIPPVPLMGIFALLMWLLSLTLPGIRVYSTARIVVALILVAVSIIISLAGVYSFRMANTTVDPRKPSSTSSLVQSGIYRWTRNPMYVGFMSALLAWGVYLSNLWALALSLGYIIYMNRFQIQLEEKMLEEVFGNDYLSYKQKVRRWL